MKEGLHVGAVNVLSFSVSVSKTVPRLYPESPDFASMPEVFATGYMVGLMEWCCIESLRPYLEPGEGSLGTLIEVTHCAPTPPGLTVTVVATAMEINGRSIVWNVVARDDVEVIGEGRVGRTVVAWDRFQERLTRKLAQVGGVGAASNSVAEGL